MKIKSGTEIIVTFAATAIGDIDSSVLMDHLFDNTPNMRVFNPGYREIKKLETTKPKEK